MHCPNVVPGEPEHLSPTQPPLGSIAKSTGEPFPVMPKLSKGRNGDGSRSVGRLADRV